MQQKATSTKAKKKIKNIRMVEKKNCYHNLKGDA